MLPLWNNVAQVELVTKELNQLAAIFHVYAGGLNFMKQKKNLLLFFKKSKIAQIYYYDLQSAGKTLQSP